MRAMLLNKISKKEKELDCLYYELKDYIDSLTILNKEVVEWVQVDFFEGVYFYEPTQELLDYMKELDEKYNN